MGSREPFWAYLRGLNLVLVLFEGYQGHFGPVLSVQFGRPFWTDLKGKNLVEEASLVVGIIVLYSIAILQIWCPKIVRRSLLFQL